MYYVHRQAQLPQGAIPLPLAEGSELRLEEHPAPRGPGSQGALERLFADGMTNHGRAYMTTWPSNSGSTWGTEAFLEAVRRADHPEKPSRMTSGYAFEDLSSAYAFIGKYGLNSVRNDIFEVGGTVLHRGNMELASINISQLAGAFSFALAHAYWLGTQGAAPALWEILLEPPIRLGPLIAADVH